MQVVARQRNEVQAIGWPVDAHVHLHCLRTVPAAFNAAAANFAAAAPRRAGLLGGLLLTQMSRERVFEALYDMKNVADWSLGRVSGEPESLIARKGAQGLAVICGRQVRADDGLEVAALGTRQSFADGRPFSECLHDVVSSGAVTAVPWGFGKWVGTRGALVAAVLAREENAKVFVGDSGSRSSLLGEPTLITRLRDRGLRVLAGTDPFPFASDHRRVGSFGFLADVNPDSGEGPWSTLRDWLQTLTGSPPLYGRPSGLARFLINQFGMQAYNRLPRSAGS